MRLEIVKKHIQTENVEILADGRIGVARSG